MGGMRMIRGFTMAAMSLLLAAPLAAAPGPERAAALEAEAEALAEAGVQHWGRAAGLLREAASERVEGDPQAVTDLIQAGRLSWYSKQGGRALRDLERAGDLASEYGDLVRAVQAYLDGAWVAREMGDGAKAYALGVKGHRLAQSPLIAADLREELLRRVEAPPAP